MRDNTREFIKFVIARHAIYVARKSKREWPWTKDPILRQYKFCNIYRELDRVTRWISANWRQPNQNDPDFWFAAFLARRCINLLATLSVIGAIAHRQCRLIWLILHQGVRYEERGPAVTKQSKHRRTAKMIRQLRSLGYRIDPPNPQHASTA
jgi:hypothetical protein